MNDEIKAEKALTLFLWLGLCFTIVATVALIGGFANAQTVEQPVEGIAEPDNLVDAKLEFLKEDIIDSREVPVYELDEETKLPVKTLLKEVQYYYAGAITDKIIQDEGDYSYVERIGANSFRVYTAPFIKDGDAYRTLEVATTSVMHWYEQVEMEAKDPISKLWDPLFIETHAQSVFGEIADGHAGCSWVANDYPWSGESCDNYDATDDSGNTFFAYSGQWDNRTGFLTFDTSSLTGTVASADLHIFYNNSWDNAPDTSVWITAGTQADPLTIADQWAYATTGGIERIINDGTMDYEYIAYGVDGLVTLGDLTKLAVVSNDLYNESSTVTNNEMIAFNTAEVHGSGVDPYLEITLGSPPVSTTTASTTPGILLPMADGLSMMMGVLAGWLLMLLFIYALWPA